MIDLRITDLLLSSQIQHLSTDWQVAEDLQFTSIKVESIADTTNLTSIRFDTVLDPEIKYYARSRVLLSTGYTAWSNIDIFTPEDVDDPNFDAPIPSIVTIPQVTITNDGVDVPVFNTNISLNEVTVVGGATHVSTSYLLEDMEGNVVWSSFYNVDDKLSKDIPPGVMSTESIYRVHVVAHTDSRDSSQMVTRTIKTETAYNGLIISELVEIDPDNDLIVEVDPNLQLSGVVGKLYTLVNNRVYLVTTVNGAGSLGNIITIPNSSLKPLTTYILRVDTSDSSKWEQREFVTTA